MRHIGDYSPDEYFLGSVATAIERLGDVNALGISPDAHACDGGSLLSYLLFEAGYTRRLIELGYADTMQRSAEVIEFFDAP